MKARNIVLIIVLLLGTNQLNAQNKTEKFRVLGKCSTCEERIEKAAKSVDGVQTADWNKKTKMIELTFDLKKTNLHKIQMAIVKAGYDTDKHKAKSKAYHGFPGCCKFDRPE
jgi:copper chaperone CopZ